LFLFAAFKNLRLQIKTSDDFKIPDGILFLGQPLRNQGYPKKPLMILKIAVAIFGV